MTRARRIAAEGFGTAFLLAGVVGSGIMGGDWPGGTSQLRCSPTRLQPPRCS